MPSSVKQTCTQTDKGCQTAEWACYVGSQSYPLHRVACVHTIRTCTIVYARLKELNAVFVATWTQHQTDKGHRVLLSIYVGVTQSSKEALPLFCIANSRSWNNFSISKKCKKYAVKEKIILLVYLSFVYYNFKRFIFEICLSKTNLPLIGEVNCIFVNLQNLSTYSIFNIQYSHSN